MNGGKHWERRPPRAGEEILSAVEDQHEIRKAMETWNRKLLVGTVLSEGLGGYIAWNPSEKFWCHFSGFDRRGRREKLQHSYWNPFGLIPERHRQNMIVEINPPDAGQNTNKQGIVARDLSGAAGAGKASFDKLAAELRRRAKRRKQTPSEVLLREGRDVR